LPPIKWFKYGSDIAPPSNGSNMVQILPPIKWFKYGSDIAPHQMVQILYSNNIGQLNLTFDPILKETNCGLFYY